MRPKNHIEPFRQAILRGSLLKVYQRQQEKLIQRENLNVFVFVQNHSNLNWFRLWCELFLGLFLASFVCCMLLRFQSIILLLFWPTETKRTEIQTLNRLFNETVLKIFRGTALVYQVKNDINIINCTKLYQNCVAYDILLRNPVSTQFLTLPKSIIDKLVKNKNMRMDHTVW